MRGLRIAYLHVVFLEVERQLSIVSMVELGLQSVAVDELDLLEVEEDWDTDFARHHKDDVLAQ